MAQEEQRLVLGPDSLGLSKDGNLNPKETNSGVKRLLQRSCIAVLAIIGIIFVISLFPYPATKYPEGECTKQERLRHVLVLHRHGERSAIHWFDYEGNWAWNNTDIGMGKLTVNGISEGFKLGQSLRARYIHHMELEDDVVTCKSTDVDRTVDTANAVLLGLFSPLHTHTKPVEVCECRPAHGERSPPECIASCIQLGRVPPVPVVDVVRKSSPSDDARAFYQAEQCKGYAEWNKRLETGKQWKHAPEKEFPDASEAVSTVIGSNSIKVLHWPGHKCEGCLNLHNNDFNYLGFMGTVWGNLVCYDSIPQPYSSAISNPELFDVLQPVADYIWRARYAPHVGKLVGGMLLNRWLEILKDEYDHWKLCSNKPVDFPDEECQRSESARMTIFSAHDTTVFSLLAALGATKKADLPVFAAHIMMELWETSSGCSQQDLEFSIRLRYNDKFLKFSPACPQGVCSFDEFIENTKESVMSPESCKKEIFSFSHDLGPDTGCCTTGKS